MSNLDFEAVTRSRFGVFGAQHDESQAPPYWGAYGVVASPDRSDRRPGSAGAQSVKCESSGPIQLFKEFDFLEPGQVLNVSGWLKGSNAGGYIHVHIGEGAKWGDPNHRNNQFLRVPLDGTWKHFSLTYVVPSSTTGGVTTRVVFGGGQSAAVTMHFDDCNIEVH